MRAEIATLMERVTHKITILGCENIPTAEVALVPILLTISKFTANSSITIMPSKEAGHAKLQNCRAEVRLTFSIGD